MNIKKPNYFKVFCAAVVIGALRANTWNWCKLGEIWNIVNAESSLRIQRQSFLLHLFGKPCLKEPDKQQQNYGSKNKTEEVT